MSDLSLLMKKLKQEVVDTNHRQKFLTEQFNEFSDSLQMQKTDFQLKVLENRVQSLEAKVNEEPNSDLEFVEALRQIAANRKSISSQPMPLHLTDIIDKNEGNRTRKRFDTIITNKKGPNGKKS
jgi:hypothetical protein